MQIDYHCTQHIEIAKHLLRNEGFNPIKSFLSSTANYLCHLEGS